MGKKSKKQTKQKVKSGGHQRTADGEEASLASSLSQQCTTKTFSEAPKEPTPPNGWARELRQAEKELKRNPSSEELIFRVAHACRVMRQWEKLRKVVHSDVVTSSSSDHGMSADDRKLLNNWVAESDKILSCKRTRVREPQIQSLLNDVFKDDTAIDLVTCDHQTYSNLNLLQYAAAEGDIQLLEKVMALGAALDFCKDNKASDYASTNAQPKPPGSTALLLAVVGLVSARKMLQVQPNIPQMQETYDGLLEVAIQLVRLGADCHIKLRLPPNSKNQIYFVFRTLGLVGKSIKQMASITGSSELVDTMKQLDSDENKIELVNCRCGSRLPWKDCHYSEAVDQPYHQTHTADEGGAEKLIWRYSPLAPCHCKLTKKSYFRCCWEESFKPTFQDDVTSILHCNQTIPLNDMTRPFFSGLSGLDPDGEKQKKFFEMGSNEKRAGVCKVLREMGQPALKYLALSFHPKSQIGEWDINVYAGVVERIDNFFQWNDIHWKLPKPELLLRVKEWNEALEKYCDDSGLTGAEREKVIKNHTASPLAPCANLTCDKIEKKVKEFQKCSRCVSVAYCSVGCQRQDWATHKKKCIPKQNYGTGT